MVDSSELDTSPSQYGVNSIIDHDVWYDIQNAIGDNNIDFHRGNTQISEHQNEQSDIRKCSVGWINSDNNQKLFDSLCKLINEYNNGSSNWNLDILGLESLQYTIYNGDVDDEGEYYSWHFDTSPQPSKYDWHQSKLIRKISMTIFLNDPDDYEGGEFDLETVGPDFKRKGRENRYDTFKLPKGSILLFPSNKWHRVRTVTSGIRKSLVGWFVGPPYK